MRPSNTAHTVTSKEVARIKYANRQIDKFIKASLDNKGYLKYKDLLEVYDHYNIKVYG